MTTPNPVEHRILDGSLVPQFRQRLALRIARLLQYADESKQRGVGILSLPETDDGLHRLSKLCSELEFGVPLPPLRNIRAASWPRYSPSRRIKLRQAVQSSTVTLANEAERLLKLSGPCLGVFPEGSHWSRDLHPSSPYMRYTPKAYFLNAVYRGQSTSLQVLPILGRLFGASAEDLLSSLLASSCLEAELIRLSDHYGYFDHVFTGLLVGNKRHLALWARMEFTGHGLPPSTRSSWNTLRSWILGSEIPASELGYAPRTKFDAAVRNAFLGIARGDVRLIDQGVVGLLETWPRTDLAVWVGCQLPFLNIPAIAVIRTARRAGLAPSIPEVEDVDRELIEAPDPAQPVTPFALYPGIDLMIREPGLEPATLFVGERVVSAENDPS